MKKKQGKLVFDRETLVVLQDRALAGVAGGHQTLPQRPLSIEPLVSCPAGPNCRPTGP